MHIRQQIRGAVDTILSMSPVTWNSVIASRIPSSRRVTPYLLVFTENESLKPISIHAPYEYMRVISLVVSGISRVPNHEEKIEDALDAIQEEIEKKLTHSAMKSQIPAVLKTILTSSEKDIVDDDDQIYGVVTLTYAITVNTTEGNPAV